jgi:hypothetical protein
VTFVGKRYGVEVQWLWFDLWVGAYWDRVGRMLYVCPLPTVVFKFWRKLP